MRIRCADILSFEKLDLAFNDYKLCNVVGANGSGKTNLLELLGVCLYGKHSKKFEKSNFVRMGAKKGEVSVEVPLDTFTLVVSRFYSPSEKLRIEVDGEEKQFPSLREAQKFIDDLFGDYQFFLATTLYSQENFEPFISSDDSSKKGILEVILQLEQFTLAQEVAKKRCADVQNKIDTCNIRLVKLKGYISALLDNQTRLNDLITKEEARVKEDTKAIQAQIDSLYPDIVNTGVLSANLELKKKELSRMKDKRYELEAEANKLIYVNQMVARNKSELLEKQQELEELKLKLAEDKHLCPTCKQNLPADKVQEIRDGFDKKIQMVTARICTLQTMQLEPSDPTVYTRKVTVIDDMISELDTEVNKLSVELTKTQLNNDAIKDRIEMLKRELISNALETYQKELAELKVNLEEYVEDEKKENSILVNHQAEQSVNSFWVDGFGNKGIKSYLLETSSNFLNDRINYYLDIMTNGRIIAEFSALSKTQSGELRDKISIGVAKDGVPMDYRQLSGGQKTILNTSVMLALRELAKKKRAVMPIIFFDEVFSHLDTEYNSAIFRLLRGLSDVSVFVVTHTSGVLDSFATETIKVSYDNYKSKVDYGTKVN